MERDIKRDRSKRAKAELLCAVDPTEEMVWVEGVP